MFIQCNYKIYGSSLSCVLHDTVSWDLSAQKDNVEYLSLNKFSLVPYQSENGYCQYMNRNMLP